MLTDQAIRALQVVLKTGASSSCAIGRETESFPHKATQLNKLLAVCFTPVTPGSHPHIRHPARLPKSSHNSILADELCKAEGSQTVNGCSSWPESLALWSAHCRSTDRESGFLNKSELPSKRSRRNRLQLKLMRPQCDHTLCNVTPVGATYTFIVLSHTERTTNSLQYQICQICIDGGLVTR